MFVMDVKIVEKSSIFGYQGTSKSAFLKITLRQQTFIASCKRVLKDGFYVPSLGNVNCFQSFESNIPFVLRYMIDAKMQGCSWVQVSKYHIRDQKYTVSSCQLEIDVMFSDLIAYEPEGDWSKIAPLRILSFDIECAGRKGIFPEAEIDPVIQIANVVTIQGEG